MKDMTDLTRCKCPICGTFSPVRITDSILSCTHCGMSDSASQFKEVPLVTAPLFDDESFQTNLGNGTMLTTHFPPQEIEEAVFKVHNYFRERNAGAWAFGPLQSREYENTQHPNLARVGLTGAIVGPDLQLDDVKRLAMAFQCDVVPRPTDETIERAAVAAQKTFSIRDILWETLDEKTKQRYIAVARALAREFGLQ